jgi:CBS domain-containing protein
MKHFSVKQILERIDQTERFDEVRSIRDQVHEMLQKHLLFTSFVEVQDTINQFHEALIRRTIFLAEKRLEEQGHGVPPVQYSFILFGSGGRREQTLWSDQDNGFIYADSEFYTAQELDAYFTKLTACIIQGLVVLGYPPCQGNVVSTNAQWRKPYSAFFQMMLNWLETPDWENVRYLLILADMRSIYGDSNMVAKLKEAFNHYVKMNPAILQQLLSNTLHHKVSLGVFGQLITERYGEDAGGVDIKYGAYLPIVNAIRLLAIGAGLQASSTLERFDALIAGNQIPQPFGAKWQKAFAITLKLRNLTPFQMEEGLYKTRGKLTAEQISKELRQQLKFCLRAGTELQRFIKKSVGTRG